jgi:hypothetical protein
MVAFETTTPLSRLLSGTSIRRKRHKNVMSIVMRHCTRYQHRQTLLEPGDLLLDGECFPRTIPVLYLVGDSFLTRLVLHS